MPKKFFCITFVFLILLLTVSESFAASPAALDPTIDSAIEYAANISNFSSGTADAILKIARKLFLWLAMLSLLLGMGRMVLTGESNVGTFVVHIARWLLYVGIFQWLMSSLSSASFIPKIIINSFVQIASNIGGSDSIEIAPDEILSAGIRIYGVIVERGWNAGWGDFLGITFIGIIILVVIAMIAGYIAVAVVEMHLVICGGAVLLGFGGFEYTRDIALSYLRYAISVGIKLVMITIVYSLAATLIPRWETAFQNSTDMTALITGAGQILGASISVLMIVKIIPNIAQSIVNNAAMTFGHNAPAVGYTSYVETRGVPWINPNSFAGRIANSFIGVGGRSYQANMNADSIQVRTARADEVMFSEGGLNQTQIKPPSGSETQARTETFTNYVPPARTTRNDNDRK